MTALRSKVSVILSLLLILGFIGTSAAGDADVEGATGALRACVDSTMPDERKKERADVDDLLATCKSDLDAVLDRVPQNLRKQIEHDIRHDIDKEPKKGGR